MRNETLASEQKNEGSIPLTYCRDDGKRGSKQENEQRIINHEWQKDGSSDTGCENEQTDPLDGRIQVEDELRQERAVSGTATRKPSIWANTDESPYTIILTGGALGGRALRASRCCHVMRQCARSAREKRAGVEAGGELSGACTVTRWPRSQRIQARRG